MMEKLRQTPSQTVGPFFAYSLTAKQYGYDYNSLMNGLMTDDDTEGECIYITGCIYDGNGQSIPDALIELWQADANGQYRSLPIHRKNDGFTGFGRLGTGTDVHDRFLFTTIKPGSIGAGQAPHINVILFMRGSLHQLYTRIYFSDASTANSQDELLSAIPEERRHTLIAQRQQFGGKAAYRFDIHMQGDQETVFFDVYNK